MNFQSSSNFGTYKNRHAAGVDLGKLLLKKDIADPVILALPRGGVIIALEVAKILNTSFDVVIARKIGSPGYAEFGIGAVSEDGMPYFNPSTKHYYQDQTRSVQKIVDDENIELKRRIVLYRNGRSIPDVQDRNVILVDDGVATGVTAVAASLYLKKMGAHKVILAVPVAPKYLDQHLINHLDEIVSCHFLTNFSGVGQWYEDFSQVEDSEVLSILEEYEKPVNSSSETSGKHLST